MMPSGCTFFSKLTPLVNLELVSWWYGDAWRGIGVPEPEEKLAYNSLVGFHWPRNQRGDGDSRIFYQEPRECHHRIHWYRCVGLVDVADTASWVRDMATLLIHASLTVLNWLSSSQGYDHSLLVSVTSGCRKFLQDGKDNAKLENPLQSSCNKYLRCLSWSGI